MKKNKKRLFNDIEVAVLALMGLVIVLTIVMMSCISSIGYEKKPSPTVTLYPLDIQDETVPKIKEPVINKEPAFTDEEISLMCRVVMSEASILCDDAKQAIASVILNRLESGKWGNTVEEVVYYPNAFSTADNGEPNAECYEAVMAAIKYRDGFPRDMYYFRTNYYHSFGTPYTHIENTYFSTEE